MMLMFVYTRSQHEDEDMLESECAVRDTFYHGDVIDITLLCAFTMCL